MTQYDVVMVGGGVMACATAYFLLKADPTVKIAIVEKDPSYAQSSTVLSDGNIRIQFNLKENILISQFGMKKLETFSEDMAIGDNKPQISFRQQGNLFLPDEAGKESALAGLELQQSMGCDVVWWDVDKVVAEYPFINGEMIAGGTFGAKDGSMDPQAILLAYKNKAVHLGATYIVGEVIQIVADKGQIQGVRLADGSTITGKYVLNSSGAWGTHLAKTAGVDLPIQPVMRHVFHLETHVRLEKTAPMIFFPSGLYLVHEHDGHYTCGKSLEVDEIGFDFTFKKQLFTDYFWEDLVNHAPAFEQLKVVGGWAGLYDVNTLDHNGLIGEWSPIKGLFLVSGFSGHGFQQCHAVGSYLADLILGRIPEIDLSIFTPERVLTNSPVPENRHRII